MPSPSQLHVNAALSQISVQFQNSQYIGLAVAPLLAVTKISDVFFKYGEADFFTRVNDLADDKSLAQELDYTLSQDTYSCRFHANRTFVSDEEIRNADQPLNPMIDATEQLTNNILLGHEKACADLVFNPANYGSNTASPATKWDVSSSTPIANIQTAIDATLGNDPLHAIIGIESFRALQRHPDLTAAFHFVSEGAVASADQIARFFGFKSLSIGEARINTAAKGQPPVLSRIWGDSMLVFRKPDAPAPRKAALAYTFSVGDRQVITERHNMIGGGTGGEFVKVTMNYDVKLISASAGFLISNTNT